MIRILCVDDDEARLKLLKEIISEKCSINQENIDTCTCINDARVLLRTTYYHFLVLDVVLPIRNDEKADHNNGISFVYELERRKKYKQPGKIIGITSFINERPQFEEEFEDKTFTIIPAPFNSTGWLDELCNAIQVGKFSTRDEDYELSDVVVVSVHGIQTYGNWQDELDRSLKKSFKSITHFQYKYGFFPLFLFLIPFLRFWEVRRFIRNTAPHIENARGKKIVIIAHSFGTYIAYHAMKKILKTNPMHIDTVIFSGSMLKSSCDLSFLNDSKTLFINDCGKNDIVLCLSQLFVFGAGMAGRAGFSGFNSQLFTNRFFMGGHSLYFGEEKVQISFIDKYWIPVIAKTKYPKTDCRKPPGVMGNLCISFMHLWGLLKDPTYVLASIYGGGILLQWW